MLAGLLHCLIITISASDNLRHQGAHESMLTRALAQLVSLHDLDSMSSQAALTAAFQRIVFWILVAPYFVVPVTRFLPSRWHIESVDLIFALIGSLLHLAMHVGKVEEVFFTANFVVKLWLLNAIASTTILQLRFTDQANRRVHVTCSLTASGAVTATADEILEAEIAKGVTSTFEREFHRSVRMQASSTECEAGTEACAVYLFSTADVAICLFLLT